MNQNDRDYLDDLMLERMSHHVGLHKDEFFPDSEQFHKLEEQYNEALAALPKDKAEIVSQYIQAVHNRSNTREMFSFRFGLRDGFKLGQLARELTDSE